MVVGKHINDIYWKPMVGRALCQLPWKGKNKIENRTSFLQSAYSQIEEIHINKCMWMYKEHIHFKKSEHAKPIIIKHRSLCRGTRLTGWLYLKWSQNFKCQAHKHSWMTILSTTETCSFSVKAFICCEIGQELT